MVEVLFNAHLKATGKEISRGEALAALMAAGLGSVIDHPDFGGNGT